MTIQLPFATREVRWFFDGAVDRQPELASWFENSWPFVQAGTVNPPTWQPRRNNEPDVYLLLPGQEDMGIKWREGLLQIKGLVAEVGEHTFCGRHSGRVERWLKWSYAHLPAEYRALCEDPSLKTVSVSKIRAVRVLDLGPDRPIEVGADTKVTVGMVVELGAVTVNARTYSSLGIEAFPDDRLAGKKFYSAVDAVLDSLNTLSLDPVRSLSYVAWLNRL